MFSIHKPKSFKLIIGISPIINGNFNKQDLKKLFPNISIETHNILKLIISSAFDYMNKHENRHKILLEAKKKDLLVSEIEIPCPLKYELNNFNNENKKENEEKIELKKEGDILIWE